MADIRWMAATGFLWVWPVLAGGVKAPDRGVPPAALPSVTEAATHFLAGLTPETQQQGDIRMTIQQVLTLKAKSAPLTLVDVRTPQERAVVAMPGSLAIPLDGLMAQLGRIPRDQPVVMVCHSGPRGVIAATVLRMLGYTNVYALNGGIHALADINAKTAPNPAQKDENIAELGGDDHSCD
jgi:rhodanese-related sulfurtransferase